VDSLLSRATQWREEFESLREIVLRCGLTEELKWGQPCYGFKGRNVALIHGFKDYCALLFMKGALLKDPNGVLIRQTENVQSARQIRFVSSGQIRQLEPVVTAYVLEAIEIETSGASVVRKATSDFAVPDEFQTRLDADPELERAFKALTPGRQRGYLLHFAAAKQAKTRQARIDKHAPAILQGRGLDD
jgi:uncharacterized protein YdeI (YjbR/CyaY-like superfamily)